MGRGNKVVPVKIVTLVLEEEHCRLLSLLMKVGYGSARLPADDAFLLHLVREARKQVAEHPFIMNEVVRMMQVAEEALSQ